MTFLRIELLFYLISCCVFSLTAEDSLLDPYSSSLTKTQSLLPTTIQSVSTISGQWIEAETDFIVAGPESLTLTRSYAPGYTSGKLGMNWDFNKPQELLVENWLSDDVEYLDEKKNSEMPIKARLPHPNGITTIHKGKIHRNDKNEKIIRLPLSDTRGLTNCSMGEISARTNLHNSLLQIDTEKLQCAAITGSGHLTYYSFKKEYHSDRSFTPEFEQKPNGNRIVFKDNKIETYNPDSSLRYGWIKTDKKNLTLVEASASNGQKAQYHFNTYVKSYPEVRQQENRPPPKQKSPKDKRFCLVKAEYSHKTPIEYAYDHPEISGPAPFPPNPLLKTKSLPDGRFQSVEYYKEGENHLDQLPPIKITDKKDFRIFRVKEISAPVGHDGSPIVTQRFIYSADEPSKAKNGKSFSGYTEVYDAYMNKTVYAYNREHRPIAITRTRGDGQIHSVERFVWNEEKPSSSSSSEKKKSKDNKDNILPRLIREHKTEGILSLETSYRNKKNRSFNQDDFIKKAFQKQKITSQIGNLLCKYTQDGSGNIHHALFFTYDSIGNILEERFFGNLNGLNPKFVELDGHQHPLENGIDCYKKQFTYSNDPFNLLLTEKEDNGKEIENLYLKNSDLISAKYIKDSGAIKFRQFFFYDGNNTLIKVIKDDGSAKNSDDLTDITQRLITNFIPQRKRAPYGLPERIEQFYWDSNQNCEVLLNRVDCEYTAEGRRCHEHHFDANGQHCYTLTWQYDAHGNVTDEINALGHHILRSYDENDNLIFEQGPKLNEWNEYIYDRANRLIAHKKHADGQCQVTEHRYDYRGSRTSTIDHFGETTHFHYDALGRLYKTEHPPILHTEDWVLSPISEVTYDFENRPIEVNDSNGKTTLTYNARGKPVSKTQPDGTVEKFTYNLDGSLAKSIASNGVETRYIRDFLGRTLEEETYDSLGQFICRQSFIYKGSNLISKVDPSGNITSYTYDGAGRLISETCGSSAKTVEYDTLGRPSKVKQWYGHTPHEISIKSLRYDFLNQVIEELLEDSSRHTLQKISYAYDEHGNKTSTERTTETCISLTEATFQADGLPLKIKDAEGKEIHYTYDYKHRNAIGQTVLKTIQTDTLGRMTHSIFDALGRLREIILYDSFGTLLSKQEIYYDPAGRKIKTIDSVIFDGAVQRTSVNAWRHHVSGQEDLIVEAAGTDEQKVTRIFYNALSQKERVQKPSGIELYYHYDSLGRLLSLTSSDHSVSYAYAYNLQHQVVQVVDNANQTTMTRFYDIEGNLTQETLGNGLTLSYAYDRMSRPVNLTLPDDSSIAYLYNAAYLKEIQRHKENKLVYQHENLRHDLSGSVLEKNLIGKAGKILYRYDILGRMQSIQNDNWSESIDYDSGGRVSNVDSLSSIGLLHSSYTYDPLDHLQTEQGPAKHVYQTDSLHNRLRKDVNDYAINPLNQVTQQGDYNYHYDTNGNLTQKIKGNLETAYYYDALDRLIKVSTPENTIYYTYDAFHRRLSKTSENKTIRYLYQGQNEIGCVDAEGKITELRVLGIGVDAEIGAAVALELQENIYAPLHDHQGNVACLIDVVTGQPSETYRYTAFGEETILNGQGAQIKTSEVGNPWRFASKRQDPETGWIYFGRRYYDPEIGRWTTPDPLSFADGPNLYAYLHHNPLNAYDAYGLVGEAYWQSLHSADVYFGGGSCPPMPDLSAYERADIQADLERAAYISNLNSNQPPSNAYHAVAGVAHGVVNFFTNQLCDIASLCCAIGASELGDSWEERQNFQAAYSQSQAGHLESFDNWVGGCLCVDPNNTYYQNCRTYTTVGLEVASLACAGYGLAKSGIGAARVARLAVQGEKFVGKVAAKELRSAMRTRGNAVRLKNPVEVIHVTPQGVAVPSDLKYQIPTRYVENKYRPGSYGELINGQYQERLRIDPATLPGKKGPNHSHYHLNNKGTHYSPRPGDPDIGFGL